MGGDPSRNGRRLREPEPLPEPEGGRRSNRELIAGVVMTGRCRSPQVDPRAAQAAPDSAKRASQSLSQIP